VKSTLVSEASQKTKGKNFSVEEGRLLASAWLNVSTDTKQGTNQIKATFWTSVHILSKSLADFSKTQQEFTVKLMGWEGGGVFKIEAVSKFCGYISQIDGRNQSGLTIHDRVCNTIS
jgi:hypothetical protein